MDKVKAESIFDEEPVIGTIDIPEPDPVDYKSIEREFLRIHPGIIVPNLNRVFALVPNYIEAENGIVEKTEKVENLPTEKITKKSLFKKFKDLFCGNDFPNDNYEK
jgi:hypothetical protein